MYGTLGRMQPKAGKRDELIRMMSAPPAGEAAKGYRGSNPAREPGSGRRRTVV